MSESSPEAAQIPLLVAFLPKPRLSGLSGEQGTNPFGFTCDTTLVKVTGSAVSGGVFVVGKVVDGVLEDDGISVMKD